MQKFGGVNMYPCLIPKWALNADVHICLSSEGLSEDGEETKDIEIDSKCNLQFKDVQKLTAQKEMITIIGKAMFPGDIAPNVSEIKGGTLEHSGEMYDVYKIQRNYNFDGTVNYTTLELM